MMAQAPYKTLKCRADDQFIVNKSRFIGYAAPCQSEEEALSFLKEIREKHKDATHNCYAYIIGRNMGVMRYSDDGEPGGTAGMPIIETMKQVGVTDCCVVVTRYFGGVLLGAGGLVRAYRKGCVVALNAAKVVSMIPSTRFLMEVPYPLWDKVRYAMKDMPLQIEDTAFSTAVEATLLVRTEDLEAVQGKLVAVTDGKAEFLELEENFLPWPEENAITDEE